VLYISNNNNNNNNNNNSDQGMFHSLASFPGSLDVWPSEGMTKSNKSLQQLAMHVG